VAVTATHSTLDSWVFVCLLGPLVHRLLHWPPQSPTTVQIIVFLVVGGVVTGLMCLATTHIDETYIDETEPTTSDNFWIRAPAIFFFFVCLCVGGYFVFKLRLLILGLLIIALLGG
jgi:hypothetical protein